MFQTKKSIKLYNLLVICSQNSSVLLATIKKLNFNDSTLKIASYVENELQLPGVVHLTARYFDKNQIDYILAELKRLGINNILALRGDLVPGKEPKNDFKYASDLIEYIKQKDSNFKIFGACYPEGHPESPDKVTDIRRLQTKVAAGCDCLITQMFFSNETFLPISRRLCIS